jgi:hypothetical protein
MPKKLNDYYDRDNQVQYETQTWKCTECDAQVEVLSAVEISHKCPKNKSQITFFERM